MYQGRRQPQTSRGGIQSLNTQNNFGSRPSRGMVPRKFRRRGIRLLKMYNKFAFEKSVVNKSKRFSEPVDIHQTATVRAGPPRGCRGPGANFFRGPYFKIFSGKIFFSENNNLPPY